MTVTRNKYIVKTANIIVIYAFNDKYAKDCVRKQMMLLKL